MGGAHQPQPTAASRLKAETRLLSPAPAFALAHSESRGTALFLRTGSPSLFERWTGPPEEAQGLRQTQGTGSPAGQWP